MGYFNNPNRERSNNSNDNSNERYERQERRYDSDNNNNYRKNYDNTVEDEIFSVPVKAGKRIYYFDVKATRADDYYVTITESRKKPSRDGGFFIDRHKIHLYKEDFMKFAEGLTQVLQYIREQKPEFAEAEARGDFEKSYDNNNQNNYDNTNNDETSPLEKEIFGDM